MRGRRKNSRQPFARSSINSRGTGTIELSCCPAALARYREPSAAFRPMAPEDFEWQCGAL